MVVLNINQGHNKELMTSCPLLGEYAYYVETVREYSKTMNGKEAVAKAIQHCIKNGVLAEFLRIHRSEVQTVSLFEYNAEKHMAAIREDAKEEVRDEMREEVRDEMKEEVRDEVKDEVRDAMRDEVRDAMKEEVRDEVRDEVCIEVETLHLISQIIKKVKKSKTLDVIASELECELEEIQKFHDVIQKRGTKCSAEKVLEEVMKQ